MIILSIFEAAALCYLIRFFCSYKHNNLLLWCNVKSIDNTYILPIINTIFATLYTYLSKEEDRISIFETIMLIIILFATLYCSIITQAMIVIYWIISNVFRILLIKIFSDDYFESKKIYKGAHNVSCS